jgi:hypothetical protein
MAIQEKFIQLVNRLFSKVVPSRPVKQEQQDQIKEIENEPITRTGHENQEEQKPTPAKKVKRGRKKKI